MNGKSRKIGEERLKLRRKLWPDVPDDQIWDRTKSKGFITMPRVAPYLFRIMDALTKNHPVSDTYLALWCRGFDEGLVSLSAQDMAFESGFSGQRAVQTWGARMKLLRELGFIRTQTGPAGDLSYALILNPFLIVKELRSKGNVDDQDYNGLLARAHAVGSKDLD